MSVLREKLENSNDAVFTAEFASITGGGMASVQKNAARLAPWFDAVNATDNPAAHAHTSNTATAIAMAMHGLEPIMQIVCRDKNRLAIQSDMLGAALHGITKSLKSIGVKTNLQLQELCTCAVFFKGTQYSIIKWSSRSILNRANIKIRSRTYCAP